MFFKFIVLMKVTWMRLFMFQVYYFDESYLDAFIYVFQVYYFDESYLGAFIYVLNA